MTPRSDDEQLRHVDRVIRSWRQGDCAVGEHWFVHRLATDTPLTKEAADAAKQDRDLAETQVRGFVVVSQTCDVVRSCGGRPYVEVAPLVEVDSRELQEIARRRRPQYAFIPGLKENKLVGDLDRVMTIEKAVVASWERTAGCTSDEETRYLAQALTRKRTRFAFPDDFTEFAERLHSRLRNKHDRHSDEGEALRSLREIRVHAAPSWSDNPVEIMFWFIRNEDELDFKDVKWDERLALWLKLVPPSGRFSSVHGVVVTLDDLTARDYVESDLLDLDHLSSRRA